MLSEEHYNVQTSQSVADALGTIEAEPFNVYVLDYKLPDGSGLDVAERIRWGPSSIILISGYDPSAVTLRSEKLGISDFLEKPFSRQTICDAVKKAIGSPPANLPGIAAAESEKSQTKPPSCRLRFEQFKQYGSGEYRTINDAFSPSNVACTRVNPLRSGVHLVL